MKLIEMEIPIGDEVLHASITPIGEGGSVQIIVDKLYQGNLVKYSNGWAIWPSSPKSILYGHDLFIVKGNVSGSGGFQYTL